MTTTLLLVLATLGFHTDAKVELEPLGRLDARELHEVSGVVRSRQHPEIFWVHNDSGNPPALFAAKGDGSIVRRYRVAVPNLDWEDIAIDAQGHLYLGDIGNNGGVLPVRVVYRFPEPAPAVEPTGPLQPDRIVYYRFPGGQPFDAESLFVDGDQVMLVRKRLDQQEAELYRLPFERSTSLLAPAVLERVGVLAGFRESATGADLTTDGRWLAVCSPGRTRLYRRGADGTWQPAGALRYKSGDFEAICWDTASLRLVGESGRMYRLRPPSPPRRRTGNGSDEPSTTAPPAPPRDR